MDLKGGHGVFGFSLPRVVALLGLALAITFKLAAHLSQGARAESLRPEAPAYAGSAACAGCHAKEAAGWAASDHAHAMAPATPETVLGDFSGVRIEHPGASAQFRRDGERFIVETEGRDGKPAPFVVSHTFGWKPLQQYLVTFPDGRLQTLPWAWDTRPSEQGGQRWFHVYGDQPIPAGDVLHWTGRFQNWNHMCAECHSTAVTKGYDAASDTFATRFSEISVGCESCHGPAGNHMAWAARSPRAGDALKGFASIAARRGVPDWTPDPLTGSPAKGVARPEGDEVETCARCHARRATLSEAWAPGRPLTDTHLPSLLTSGLFEADGQMRDEVFNDHLFKQSRMYAKGVVCNDCHDPHSGRLKADGAEVCGQCHQPERFAAKAHTGHEPGAGAPDCIGCHMPSRTYMVVDKRHDHSFRIPRPDLTVALGTPNTCNACHADRSPQWAVDAVTRWHGPERKGFQTYAQAFHAAREGDPAARAQLIALARDNQVPGIARATALDELAGFPSVATEQAIRAGLADADPLARIAALRAAAEQPLATRLRWAGGLLDDPVRGVRMEAGRILVNAQDADVPTEMRVRLRAPSRIMRRRSGSMPTGLKRAPISRAFSCGAGAWRMPRWSFWRD